MHSVAHIGVSGKRETIMTNKRREAMLGTVPPKYREAYIDHQIETNVRRTFTLSIFIIGVQVALNLINILKPSDGTEVDIMKFVYLSLFTLSLGIVFLIISLMIKKGKLQNKTFRRVMPFVLLYVYASIQMVFLSFNLGTASGVNCYIIALILLGFFIIMPPIQYALSIGLYFGVTIALMFFTDASSGAWNTALVTDTWANLLIITGMVLYMSIIVYGMYRSNFLKSKELEESNALLSHAADTDALTKLLNRRGYFGRIENEWHDYVNDEGVTAVYMFDIDFFKRVNDELGHTAGDVCLTLVSENITKCFAGVDKSMVCRYGGEEFLAIAQFKTSDEAISLAERVRAEVSNACRTLPMPEGMETITISGGVAMAEKGSTESYDSLTRRADAALYRAKEHGRNQIQTSVFVV